MVRNRPRIFSTNTRMDARQFVNSWSIRGWSLVVAKVNVVREVQCPTLHYPTGTLRSPTGTLRSPRRIQRLRESYDYHVVASLQGGISHK